MLPLAEINADVITLRNIRNFDYSSETDYTPRWYDKTVDMRQLDTLDLIAVYWMGDFCRRADRNLHRDAQGARRGLLGTRRLLSPLRVVLRGRGRKRPDRVAHQLS